ncbi:MAG: type II secretion system protein J [Actinomycetota bacterium]
MSRDTGFTLLEVLVAAALFALVMILAGQGTALVMRGWRDGAAEAARAGEVVAAQRLVRRLVESARPARLAGGEPAFFGGPKRLRLVAVPMGGTATAVELRLTASGLEAWSAALDPGDPDPARPPAGGEVLVAGINGGAFTYWGAAQPGLAPAWHDRWTDGTRPPLLVRLQLHFPAGDRRRWPDLVAAPMVQAPAPFDAAASPQGMRPSGAPRG